MPGLRVAFVVQGEGRGHMTQALALASHLRDAGHEVARVLVGTSPWRAIPNYFVRGICAPVLGFAAPTQVPGPDDRGLSLLRTVKDVGRRGPAFLHALGLIARSVDDVDVVVNFLDLLGGLALRRAPSPPVVAIAHNHVFRHPALPDAPGPAHLRRAVLTYADATARGAASRIALSFDALPDRPDHGLRVAPPLLRPGLDTLDGTRGDYLLAYALNPGYGRALAAWQNRNATVQVRCYVQGGTRAIPDAPPGFRIRDLDEACFLRDLAGCRAYVGSAGFESLCEAHWLGKPVLAVPTAGHFEQTLNAWDARRCGVARPGEYADLDEFWADPRPPRPEAVRRFRAWAAEAPGIVVEAVERAARTGRRRTGS